MQIPTPQPIAAVQAPASLRAAAPRLAAPAPARSLPVAGSPLTATSARTPQMNAVLGHFASRPMPDWEGWGINHGRPDPNGPAKSLIADLAMAKLTLGVDAERVNQVLRQAAPYSKPGTHFHGPLGIKRNGDYDFSITGLTAVLHQHWNNPLLSEDTKRHLATVVLNEEGGDRIQARWGPFGLVPETENHILMTESSRYLKNQLVAKHGLDWSSHRLEAQAYDNEANGMNAWFAEHLARFTRHDFDEYNSRPYSRYTLKAVQNLYEYAEEPKVKTNAQITLDLLAVKFALASSDFRRVAPFRRRAEYNGRDNVIEKDAEATRLGMLAGLTPGYRKSLDSQLFLAESGAPLAAAGSYRTPEALADLMVNKGESPYFSRMRHENTEIHYSEANFMISAGGHYHPWTNAPGFAHENGQVMPTTVMFKNGGPLLSNALQFLGRGDSDRANNTGVYENFACGIRPQLPEGLVTRLEADGKAVRKGNWTYLEVGNTYVALFTSTDKQGGKYAPTVGFCEVVDTREFPSLQAFQARLERANAAHSFSHYGANRFTTSRGKTIEFVMAEPPVRRTIAKLLPQKAAKALAKLPRPVGPLFEVHGPKPKQINEWLIRKVWDHGKPVAIETRLDRWPLIETRAMTPDADGFANDFPVRADGTGQVLVNNQHLGKSLILSSADPQRPLRLEQNGPLQNLAEKGRISRQGGATTVTLAEAARVGYVSFKWPAGAKPGKLSLYAQVNGAWRLVEERRSPHTDAEAAFRSDFDLKGLQATAIKLVASGAPHALAAAPEVYRGY